MNASRFFEDTGITRRLQQLFRYFMCNNEVPRV